MIVLKNKHHPEGMSFFKILQRYAWQSYLSLFIILMMVLFYLLINHMRILEFGIIGVFLIVGGTNAIGLIKMKRQNAEIGFYDQQFYIQSQYDHFFRDNKRFFPLPYSNARRKGNSIEITYFDQVVSIERENWSEQDWNELIYFFLAGPRV